MTKLLALAFAAVLLAQPADKPAPVWTFAVSGDSRNCGDVVMPAIASAVTKTSAKFYWHLGDFRAIYDFDEDMVPPASLNLNSPHVTISSYLGTAWQNFIQRQLTPFGNLELFLGIGNHEVIPPQTRDRYISTFRTYLDSPRLHAQRQTDGADPNAVRTYYHWVMNNSVDFFSLDNAGNNFDAEQLAWIRSRLDADAASKEIRTIVVGMHEALPGSKGMSHSMCDSSAGIQSGREIYLKLWDLQQAGKKVYVLASHSHFIVDDVFNTPYWKGRVLPGWIVGTAGAVRYRLPARIDVATIARTDVYGYLIGSVFADGTVEFAFHEISLDDLRAANAGVTPDSLVHWCYTANADQQIPKPEACE